MTTFSIIREKIGYGLVDMSSIMFWKIFSYYLLRCVWPKTGPYSTSVAGLRQTHSDGDIYEHFYNLCPDELEVDICSLHGTLCLTSYPLTSDRLKFIHIKAITQTLLINIQ